MSQIRALVIVPYGTLHSLPFHALFDGDQYLIDRFRISYAPSASIFSHIQRQPDLGSGSSLIVGVGDDRTPFIRTEGQLLA
jgi:CHAT domain-containing protein